MDIVHFGSGFGLARTLYHSVLVMYWKAKCNATIFQWLLGLKYAYDAYIALLGHTEGPKL